MSGNIKIIPPKENFLKVPKGAIYNDEIDTLTLGVYVKVLALGTKWTLNINGLSKSLSISVAKVKAAFAVLERSGYVRRYRVKGKSGQFVGWDYEVYSEPFTDHIENRPSENADIGKNRPSENGVVYIENNNRNRDIKEKKNKNNIFRKPTLQEVSDYCTERRNGIDAEAFIAFYESKGWMVGKSPMKDWKSAIITWEKSRKTNPTPNPPPKKEKKEETLMDYYRRVFAEINGTDNGTATDNPDEQ